MHRLTIFFLLCAIISVVISASQPSACNLPPCRMSCPYGYKLDSDGCATCECKKSPCKHEHAPLKDYFCGRGPNRRECPKTHQCVIAPNDAYAVCCPQHMKTRRNFHSINKKGACPAEPQNKLGVCTSKCEKNSDCPKKQLCCGSCPRICKDPVF